MRMNVNVRLNEAKNGTILISVLRDLIMSMLVIWLLCPYQAFFSNWHIYGLLWGAWIVLAFLADAHSFNKMIFNKYVWVVFAWPLYKMILSIVDWAQFKFYQFTIPFIIIAATYYIIGKHIKSIKLFVIIYILYSILIDVNSLAELSINPEISRILANADKTITSQYAGPFMANFSYVNNLALTTLVFLFMLKNKVSKKATILALIMIILNFTVLFSAQYSIAILSALAFCVIVFLFCGKNSRNQSLKILLLTFFLILSIPFVGMAFKFIAAHMDNSYFSRRLYSIGMLLSSGTVGYSTDLAERFRLYNISIQTFFDHPILGVGGSVFGADGLAGAHSEILDNFAYYGFFGGTLFIIYLVHAYKNIGRLFDGIYKKLYFIVFSLFMLFNIVNTSFHEEILFVTFFIIPSFVFLIQEMQAKNIKGNINAG